MTRFRNPVRLLAAVSAVGLLLAACGDDSPAASEPTGAPVLAIDGATYLSDTVAGQTLVDGSRLTLSFDAGRLGANAGCNGMGGDYSIADGKLVVDQLASTEMYCDGLMDQETWFAEFLSSSPTISQAGDRITLVSGDVTLVMLDKEVADPDRPLEGITWTVTSALDGDSASTVAEGASITLNDGTAAVAAGCNTGSADYTVSDDGTELSFGPLALTKMACKGDQMDLEAKVSAALDGTVTVSIDADMLTLMNGDHGLVLTASE